MFHLYYIDWKLFEINVIKHELKSECRTFCDSKIIIHFQLFHNNILLFSLNNKKKKIAVLLEMIIFQFYSHKMITLIKQNIISHKH